MSEFVLNNALFDDAINRTGFPTEYRVQTILNDHGWDVISNRYYIDDQKRIEREIDLLATKSGIKLIISCKKSDTELWAFMTSANTSVDVPFEYKTKDRVINYYLNSEQQIFRQIIHSYPSLSSLLSTVDLVRAFQQIARNNYSPNNDKHIYDSIITTIKAAEYEGSHSPQNNAYFMLSVFEGEMVKKDFDNSTNCIIEDVKYINRHFVDDKDKYYSVHFIKLTAFERMLDLYDSAAEELPRLIRNLHEVFLSNVFSSKSRVNLFWRDVESDFFAGIYQKYGDSDSVFTSLSTNPTDIRWRMPKSGKLHLALNLWMFTKPGILGDEINKDPFCRKLMEDILSKYYGYSGEFIIENDPQREAQYKKGV